MTDLGPVAAMVAFAYAFGSVWYHLLGHPPVSSLRRIGYPLMAIILGEGFWVGTYVAGPEVLGIHVAVASIATFLAVYLDIARGSRGAIFPWQHLRFQRLNGTASVGQSRKDREPVSSQR